MPETPPTTPRPRPSPLAARVAAQARRKLRARREGATRVWFGVGMMGLVGWSVAVPTLLGAGLGVWLDSSYPGGRSWTLALLIAGLTLGCLNAWMWVAREHQAIGDDQEDDDV